MTRSSDLFQRAQQVIPGGVNSPVHAFKAVGGNPFVVEKAQGPYLFDVDGNQYIDYVGCFGPLVLGHAHPEVVDKLQSALTQGTCYGATTEANVQLAETITRLMPTIEKVRLVNSGTEATMSAIRLARGHTGRDKIIKFEGCYHGHGDALLAAAGSGPLTFGNPSSPGVTTGCTQDTLIATYNDLDSVKALLEHYPEQVAAIIVEPVAGNMNLVPPTEGFLTGLRALCDENGTVLIFDEVMTGFRVGLGGAQAHYGIQPDLTCLGKIIGGGLPVGAFGGRTEIMDKLSPEGPVYQAGTLSGNPMAVTAGLTTLEIITSTPNFYETLTQKTTTLLDGLTAAAKQASVPFTTTQVGGMFGLFFTEDAAPIQGYEQVTRCNKAHFNDFFHGMREQGVYFAPSTFEAGFVSMAHSSEDLERTITAANAVFKTL